MSYPPLFLPVPVVSSRRDNMVRALKVVVSHFLTLQKGSSYARFYCNCLPLQDHSKLVAGGALHDEFVHDEIIFFTPVTSVSL